MSAAWAPPEKLDSACRLWSGSGDKRCVSEVTILKGEYFCDFCQKLDPTVLTSMVENDKAEEKAESFRQVEQIRKFWGDRLQKGLDKKDIMCALQNPKFDGLEWRRAYRPNRSFRAQLCQCLDKSTQDEFCLCWRCALDEKGSEWWKTWIRSVPDAEEPIARIRFECVLANGQYQNEQWFRLLQPGKQPCDENHPPLFPENMCNACVLHLMQFRKDADVEELKVLDECPWVWEDGWLKSVYREEPSNIACALYRRGCVGTMCHRIDTLCSACSEHHPYLLRRMIANFPDKVKEENDKDYACVSRRERYFDLPWMEIIIGARICHNLSKQKAGEVEKQQACELRRQKAQELGKLEAQELMEKKNEKRHPWVVHGWLPWPSNVPCNQVNTPDSLCSTCVAALNENEKDDLDKYFEQSTWTLKKLKEPRTRKLRQRGTQSPKKNLRERSKQSLRKVIPEKRNA